MTPPQSSVRRYEKKAGSEPGGSTERRYSTSTKTQHLLLIYTNTTQHLLHIYTITTFTAHLHKHNIYSSSTQTQHLQLIYTNTTQHLLHIYTKTTFTAHLHKNNNTTFTPHLHNHNTRCTAVHSKRHTHSQTLSVQCGGWALLSLPHRGWLIPVVSFLSILVFYWPLKALELFLRQ